MRPIWLIPLAICFELQTPSRAESPRRKVANISTLDPKALEQFSLDNLKKNNLFPKDIPEACKKQWSVFASAPSLKNLVDDFTEGKVTVEPDCRSYEEPLFQSSDIKDIYDPRCQNLKASTSKAKPEEEARCGSAVFVYKALIVDRLSDPNLPIEQQAPIVLVNKLVAALSSNYIPRDKVFGYMRSLTDTLIQRYPDLYMAYRVRAFIYLPLLSSPQPPMREFRQALSECESFHVKDIAVAHMWVMTCLARHNNKCLKHEAKNLLQYYPKSGLGHYYMASYHWYTGDKALALNELNRANKLEPLNPIFQKTLARAEISSVGSGGLFTSDFQARFDENF